MKNESTRGAPEHSPGGWSGKTTLAKMKKMKIIKNEWCVPGPAGVARPTEAGRPVFSCVMRWPRRPAASKIRLPGWPAAPRLGRAAKVAKCKNEKMKIIKNE